MLHLARGAAAWPGKLNHGPDTPISHRHDGNRQPWPTGLEVACSGHNSLTHSLDSPHQPIMTPASDTSARVVRLPVALHTLANLAVLLERIDRGSEAPDPAQYRQLVARIMVELQARSAEPGSDLAFRHLLASFPATAELYENLRYDMAGLCLRPLDQSVDTEQTARGFLASIAASAAAAVRPGV
jgi:hypothetical protein